jgi:hypothetical protein
MPLNKYLDITIGNQKADLDLEKLDISISYSLEDRENFQQKNASTAFNVKMPATTNNDKIANTFHNPGIEDLTTGNIFKGNRRGIIEANGQEILVGKAFLFNARHNTKPIDYEYNFYGHNADWIIDLKESTLFDFVKDIRFTFSKANIIASWDFDGSNLPYCFVPIRYALPMDDFTVPLTGEVISDYDMKPIYMKPSLSKYFIIYKAFKSLGYRVESDFFDSDYFRRQLMPWTWGNFLVSDGTLLDNLDFLAKSVGDSSLYRVNSNFTGIWDLNVSNDNADGAFDNNDTYQYDQPAKEMKWTYIPAFDYGPLEATFHFQQHLYAGSKNNSDVEVRVQWFKNGVKLDNGNDNGNGTLLLEQHPGVGASADFLGSVEDWLTVNVVVGDVISAKIYLHTFYSYFGSAFVYGFVEAFELDYFRIPLGGQVNLENYPSFKKHKFLDFLSGVIDEFNLCVQTDPINKVVYFEPEHPYSTVHTQAIKQGGYFNGKTLNWEEKHDLSKESQIVLFHDYERELTFKYKDDPNDGGLKSVQDRHVNELAVGKYVFPDRFKAGQKEIENRFFSVVMHYNVVQWRGLGSVAGLAPQMICLIPENISNTSRNESQNTFEPKSIYYKGMISTVGWIFDGEEQNEFPYGFAVNYMEDGENDPILSYCDERIGPDGSTLVTGIGLVRRFYLQKLEIIRNGQYYTTYFKLNNTDVANFLHREHIICRGQRWELVEIHNYKPLKEESTEVLLRKWTPIKNA